MDQWRQPTPPTETDPTHWDWPVQGVKAVYFSIACSVEDQTLKGCAAVALFTAVPTQDISHPKTKKSDEKKKIGKCPLGRPQLSPSHSSLLSSLGSGLQYGAFETWPDSARAKQHLIIPKTWPAPQLISFFSRFLLQKDGTCAEPVSAHTPIPGQDCLGSVWGWLPNILLFPVP